MVMEGNFVGARGTQFSNSEYCSCQSTKINFYVLSKTKFALGGIFCSKSLHWFFLRHSSLSVEQNHLHKTELVIHNLLHYLQKPMKSIF